MDFLRRSYIKRSDIVSEFTEAYEYGERIVLNKSIVLEEMAAVRRKRQKLVLLENVRL